MRSIFSRLAKKIKLFSQITSQMPRLNLFLFAVAALLFITIAKSQHKLGSIPVSKAIVNIVQEELITNGALLTTSISVGPIQGGTDQFYTIIVADYYNRDITSVNGLGLTWTLGAKQCGSQNTNGTAIYTAFGSPVSSGFVTVNFSTQSPAIAATLIRYSGVDPTNPTSDAHGQNTLGVNGACSGGITDKFPHITLASSQANTLLLGAGNIRARTITIPDPDYTEIGNIVVGTNGPTTRLIVHSRYPFNGSTDTVNHTLSGTTDWTMVGLVINPANTINSPTPTDELIPTPTPGSSTPTVTPTPPSPTPTPGTEVTFVGTGDISTCANNNDESTAKLLDQIPGTVFTTGDNVYENGTIDEFNNCYDPTWGRHKARTKPAPGNHEYNTAGATGYFSYFGTEAGDPTKGYYSYDLGAWHIIVINSNCSSIGGCTSSSPQAQWLRNDLANHPNYCTLALWHHPRFSSGVSSTRTKALWQALYDYNADLILAGHAHLYERFAPQTPSGVLDTQRGIREIIVGTGGRSHDSNVIQNAANSESFNSDTYGVLKLSLRSNDYSWQFIPEAGKTFTDSGTGVCH